MKLLKFCLFALCAISLTACGGKDPKEVRKIYDNTDDLTNEQIGIALDWYIESQEKQIEALEEAIDNAEEIFIDNKAYTAGARVYNQSEIDDSDVQKSKAYKERRDQLKKNKQEIKRLTKKIKRLSEDLEEKHGFDEGKKSRSSSDYDDYDD